MSTTKQKLFLATLQMLSRSRTAQKIPLLKSEALNQHSLLLGILLADMALEPSDNCSCSESVHLHDYYWRCGSVHVPYKLRSCK